MLDILLLLLLSLSIVYSLFSGDTRSLSQAVTEGANSALSLTASLAGAMALWGGIMNVARKSGVTQIVTHFIMFPIKRLFCDIKDRLTLEHISLNVTANILGLGNAATPFAIKAMKLLKNSDGCTGRSSAYFVLLNTASVQLIPVTVSSMRQAHGAVSPWDCMAATVVTSVIALAFGLLSVRILYSSRGGSK